MYIYFDLDLCTFWFGQCLLFILSILEVLLYCIKRENIVDVYLSIILSLDIPCYDLYFFFFVNEVLCVATNDIVCSRKICLWSHDCLIFSFSFIKYFISSFQEYFQFYFWYFLRIKSKRLNFFFTSNIKKSHDLVKS